MGARPQPGRGRPVAASTRRSTRWPTPCARSAVLLHPFIPASAARMLEAVGDPGAVAWERAGMGLLPAGIAVSQPPPLFPRA